MNFLSDTTAPAHPAVIEAMARANTGYAPSYGADALSARVEARLKEIFETDLKLLFASSGTAANALALSALCPAHGAVLCHDEAHIHRDERGAPEFFTGGAKLIALPGEHGKIAMGALEDALAQWPQDFVHASPPRVLSLSNLNEAGCAYSPAETAERAAAANRHGMSVHIDGARFANAVAATGASPADLTWRAGADALSLGATKGGAAMAEAVILFPAAMERFAELQIRQKRAGQMAAKMRFIAAQFDAWLEDGLWLTLAAQANAMARALAEGLCALPGASLAHPVDGNEVFVRLPETLAARLKAAGAGFYGWPDGSARFVASWTTEQADVDALLKAAG
ncbi:MAG: threonine aldolase [Maricaulaceae bacterium]|nr:threonine aldolase [Maricaulaceae bacterium]